MLAPLLATKVSLPKSRPVPVPKQSGEGFGMNICSAWYPPRRGYGKTTTIRMWVEDARYPVACVILEKADNDLKQFLA